MKQAELLIKDNEFISDTLKLRFRPMTVDAAKGCHLTDAKGKSYLDLTAGWNIANIGYGRESVAELIREQYLKLSFTTQSSAPSETMIQLAEKLIGLTPGNFEKKIWFGHSGSDGNDLIFKFLPIATGRSKIISFIGSYHGQSPATLSDSKFEENSNVVKIPYPNEYRPFSGISENLTEQSIHLIKEVFQTICPADDTAGIILEAIQSDAGMILPPIEFLQALREICDEHGIYLIFDEVKLGMGRTGRWFSFEHTGIVPDAIVIGKALGVGLPISAVVGRKELLDAVSPAYLFKTSRNPISTTAALEGIRIIEDEQLLANAEKQGDRFLKGLAELQKKYACIGDIRGKGLAIGVEIVEDRVSKKPDALKTSALCYQAYEKGLLICNVGIHGNVLEITPPLSIISVEVDVALKLLDLAFSEVEAGNLAIDKV